MPAARAADCAYETASGAPPAGSSALRAAPSSAGRALYAPRSAATAPERALYAQRPADRAAERGESAALVGSVPFAPSLSRYLAPRLGRRRSPGREGPRRPWDRPEPGAPPAAGRRGRRFCLDGLLAWLSSDGILLRTEFSAEKPGLTPGHRRFSSDRLRPREAARRFPRTAGFQARRLPVQDRHALSRQENASSFETPRRPAQNPGVQGKRASGKQKTRSRGSERCVLSSGTWHLVSAPCLAVSASQRRRYLAPRHVVARPQKSRCNSLTDRGLSKEAGFYVLSGVWEENFATSPMEAPRSRSPAGPCRDACCSGPARSSTTSSRASSAGPSGSIRSTSWPSSARRITTTSSCG